MCSRASEGSSVPFGLDPTENRKLDPPVQRADPITHRIVGPARQMMQPSPLRRPRSDIEPLSYR
jgi:hypothetical protein